MWAVRNS